MTFGVAPLAVSAALSPGLRGGFIAYALAHAAELWTAVRIHLALSACALAIGATAGISLGIYSAHHSAGRSIVAAVNAARVVPSLAVLAFALPALGLGFAPALVALALLACPPVLINTDVAFRGVDRAVRDAAAGMGMTAADVIRRVEAPLALPVVIAGVRTASVEVIASATLATFIGAGGLGDFIVRGLQNDDMSSLLLGAACVAAIAVAAELLLGVLARKVTVA
ncbi:MAG: ABC transporter permease subunit [Candidatus Eremiobacteraeota bacterium]|nr:ABC transporter permease subunit [Candidatus Eremiobacteraeota bacterium]